MLQTAKTAAITILDVLREEAATVIFGNPGSTEMPLMDALVGQHDITYVLGLQEATALGMADGYAQMSNRPAFVNLHGLGGLGNAMGAVVNAAVSNTPLVITAGQQDARHLIHEPWLSGDAAGLVRPLTKWAHEIRSVEELGPALRRAFAIAAAEPRGPVFVSFPMNFLGEPAGARVSARSVPPKLPAADADALAEALAGYPADRVAIILSDEVSVSNGIEAAVALADATGWRVHGAPLLRSNVFPSRHPAWRGLLKADFAALRADFEPYNALLLIGGRNSLLPHNYSPAQILPENTRLYQVSADMHGLSRHAPATLALVGDAGQTLRALGERMAASKPDAEHASKLKAERDALNEAVRGGIAELKDARPLMPAVAVSLLLEALPKDIPIVNEAPCAYDAVRDQLTTTSRSKYFFARGGALGWGMPAAVGASLAEGRAPVVCLIGDGSAMYSPQALWSAAHYDAPVIFVVLNNRRYDVLMRVAQRLGFVNARHGHFVAMSLTEPAIDYAALAEAHGLAYSRAEEPQAVGEAVRKALENRKPCVIEIPIGGHPFAQA